MDYGSLDQYRSINVDQHRSPSRNHLALPLVTVLDQEDEDAFDYLSGQGGSASRRASGDSARGGAPPGGIAAGLRTPGRTSRRVSLISGEALEQANASLALSVITNQVARQQNPQSVHSPPPITQKAQSVSFPPHQDSKDEEKKPDTLSPPEGKRTVPPMQKSKTTDEGMHTGDKKPEGGGEGGGDAPKGGATTTPALPPSRMKSNQRWLKLRTTVQLSGALKPAHKPTLKREDSFIKRFSTRQIAELQGSSIYQSYDADLGNQDTVDHTDEETEGKNANGSPKVRKRKKKRNPYTVINPYGNVYFYWLCILTMCVLYNLWSAIVRQAFPELQSRYQLLWYLTDGITDTIILSDVFVQFRTGYLEQGLIVYDFKKLARHYMRSRCFILDLSALVPLDLLQIVVGMQPILRFPRFIKVYRVYNYYYMVESRTLYPNMWRVLNLVHVLLLLAHWFGCFYYVLSELEEFNGDWCYPYHHGDDFKQLSRKYLGSVYWSTLTLTTIGDLPTPESNRQYIFTIASYLIGVFIFATIVGQVGNVITNRNANRLEFERLLDGAKLYMRHHKVPRTMQRRVQRWYDYSWSRGRIQGGGDINTALGLLPDKLRTELALHVNLVTLKKVSIFKECQPEFLHDLVLKMKAYIFTPGDLICRKGEVAREMFIIADGILEVISETGKVLTTMKAGDFFGEIGILNLDGLNNRGGMGRRTADVRSVGYSELFSLSREDVLAAMKDYPEAQEILQSLGRKRLLEARHHASKSGSSGSSKRGTPSPCRDSDSAKKIVNRLKSDVTAIRDAFKRSKGQQNKRSYGGYFSGDETLEMEPLTGEPRTNDNDEETPRVKRILKKLTRDTSSVGSESSREGRGVLKRMSRVSSDDIQKTQAKHESSDEKGVLGAGLPLLQRLHLLKEKEEKEEKERQGRGKKEKTKQEDEAPKEEEPVVIGEGLPLFARLRLLKVKEEKERLEREERQRKEKEKLQNSENDVDGKSDTNSSSSIKGNLVKQSSISIKDTNKDSSKVASEDISKECKKDNDCDSKTQSKESSKDNIPNVSAAPRPMLLKGRLAKLGLAAKAAPMPDDCDSKAQSKESSKENIPTVSVTTAATDSSTTTVSVVSTAPKPSLLKGRLAKLGLAAKAAPMPAKADSKIPLTQSSTSKVIEDKSSNSDVKQVSDEPINDLNKGIHAQTVCGSNNDKIDNNNSVDSKDIHTNSNNLQGTIDVTKNVGATEGQALEKAFGKLLSSKLNPSNSSPSERTIPISVSVIEKQTAQPNSDNEDSSKEKDVKDKLHRRNSFRKAIEDGVIKSTDIRDLGESDLDSVPISRISSESDRNSPLSNSNENISRESQSEKEISQNLSHTRSLSIENLNINQSNKNSFNNKSSTGSNNKSALKNKNSLEGEDKVIENEKKNLRIRNGKTSRDDQSSDSDSHGSNIQNPPLSSLQSKTPLGGRLDLLKVPGDDVSPPMSSPESTETPERKTLKSILKRMSREDMASNTLPPASEELKKLMKSPTIHGFAARRSKFSKAVTFQRKTLSSPPPQILTDSLRNYQTGIVEPLNEGGPEKDGVCKLLARLGSIGVETDHDVVKGVRKILRNKMDDLELAWAARVDALQHELAARDATINQLAQTITRLQDAEGQAGSSGEEELSSQHTNGSNPMVIRTPSSDKSSSEESDDEPLFMRCNSIESIIHHSPEGSPGHKHATVAPRRSFPRQSTIGRCPPSHAELRSITSPNALHRKNHVALELGSSTDDDIHSISSEDDHIIYSIDDQDNDEDYENVELDQFNELPSYVNSVDEDEEDDDDDEVDIETGTCYEGEPELSSQDWEVQLLARQLAEEQRSVARQVDHDILHGFIESNLADLHEALATDKIGPLSDTELQKLEKIVRKERENLRKYARMYSLEERPVIEEDFTPLYRSRSQLLISRSNELCRAGPMQRRLSNLLDELVTLPPAEQFLLDRLVHGSAKKRRLSKQKSMCEEHYSTNDMSQNTQSSAATARGNFASRRSISVCIPPQETLKSKTASDKSSGSGQNQSTMSSMFTSLKNSVNAISGGPRSRSSSSGSCSQKEAAPLLRSPR